MDGLIILAVILMILRGVFKRAQELRQNTENRQAKPAPPGNLVIQSRETRKSAVQKPVPTPRASVNNESAVEGQARYTPIQPMIQSNNVMRMYTGSMGDKSTEGSTSAEGRDANVQTPAVTAAPYTGALPVHQEHPIQVLPDNWEGATLVQAFVMSEIFGRPRKWGK